MSCALVLGAKVCAPLFYIADVHFFFSSSSSSCMSDHARSVLCAYIHVTRAFAWMCVHACVLVGLHTPFCSFFRNLGLYYSIFVVLQQMGIAGALAFSSYLLGVSGYVSPKDQKDGNDTQPARVCFPFFFFLTRIQACLV